MELIFYFMMLQDDNLYTFYYNVMSCQLCKTRQVLVCAQCCSEKKNKLIQFEKLNKVGQHQKNSQQKLKALNINNLIKKNDYQSKAIRINIIKQRIQKLKQQMLQQKNKSIEYSNVKKQFETQLADCLKIPEEIKGNQQMLQSLNIKNQSLITKIKQQQSIKKKKIQNVMKAYNMDKKKYKIQKYFRFEESQNLMFTLQNLKNQKNGIPVIRANNEQVIRYFPLEQKQQINRQQQQTLLSILKISSKIVILTHRIFIPEASLPFKMFFSKQFLYSGNNLVSFDPYLQLSSENMITSINILQANIQFISYAIGSLQKPFLVLDHVFFQKLGKGKRQLVGFDGKPRKWKSFLKYLKLSEIINNHQEEVFSGMIVLRSQSKQSQKSSINSDQQFQVLQ